MDNSVIYSHVDHTLLRATSSWQEIKALCDEAVQHGTATVCIPPSYVAQARGEYGDRLRICTVIGFPLGYNTTAVKVAEAAAAVADGADEIDMVINIGWAVDARFADIAGEIAAVGAACGGKVLKVIVETCYLDTEQKKALCTAVREGGADFIKTSTGFGSGGATLEDVRLFADCLAGSGVRIKAAGGIRSRDDMVSLLEAGCDRLGTSSAVTILEQKGQPKGY